METTTNASTGPGTTESDPQSSDALISSTDTDASTNPDRIEESCTCTDGSPPVMDESPHSEHNSDDNILSSHHSSSSPTSTSSPAPSEVTSSASHSTLERFLGPTPQTRPGVIPTYKFTCDNLDYKTTPRDMREDHQARDLHYFQTYAAQDRIDLTGVSDEHVAPELNSIDVTKLLPTSSDDNQLRENFAVLIWRTLRKYMPYFKKLGKGGFRHIQHEYSEEMSRKTNVVSEMPTPLCTSSCVTCIYCFLV